MTSQPPVPETVVQRIVENNHEYFKRYRRGRLLGKGGFARCYEMTSYDTNRKYAGKVVAKSKLAKKSAKMKFLAEIRIHKFVSDHKHVVRFVKWFESKEHVIILLELCPNQTLMEFVERRKRLTEPEVQYFMLQLISAVRYLHSKGVIHRDLKLGNIFLGDNLNIKLGDFGLAARLMTPEERKRTLCGTPNYIAPEILAHSSEGHSFEVDIWSMGVIAYTLLVGTPPFETSNIRLTYKRIKSNYYTFPEHLNISHAAKSLVRRILHVDPLKRPSLDEIRDDAFFTSSSPPASLPPEALYGPPRVTEFVPLPKGPHSSENRADDTELVDVCTQLRKTTLGGAHRPLSEITNNGRPPPESLLPKRNRALTEPTQRPVNKENDPHSRPPLAPRNHLNNERRSATGALLSPKFTRTDQSNQANVRNPWSSGARTTERREARPQEAKETVDNGAQNLRRIHKEIEESFCVLPNGVKPSSAEQPATVDFVPPLWVLSWVDYSDKYGMGYILSDGSSGVYFNDASKIILCCKQQRLDYIEHMFNSERAHASSGSSEVRHSYTADSLPQAINKKVVLLQRFMEYLQKRHQREAISSPPSEAALPYVQRWATTTSAKIFALSNRTVQVNFNDRTELIITPAGASSDFPESIATYTDSSGIRKSYTFSAALKTPREELSKRMRYANEILEKLLRLVDADTGFAGSSTRLGERVFSGTAEAERTSGFR